MSDVRLYIHTVWAVKKRYPLLEEPEREKLFKHIMENAQQKEIHIEAIDGHDDHVHCLIKLHSTQSVSQVIRHLKGESSWWANKNTLFEKRLKWARAYYARSVDEHNLYIVNKYIANQQKHKNPFGQVKYYLERLSKNDSDIEE